MCAIIQHTLLLLFHRAVTKTSKSFLQKNMHKGPQALVKGLSQELITQIKGFHFNVAELPVSFGFDICAYAFFSFALFKLLFSNIEERKIFFYVFF